MSAMDQVRAILADAPRHINPAIEMWLAVQQHGPIAAEDMFNAAPSIQKAIEDGQTETHQVTQSLHNLVKARPQSSPTVPIGF